MGLMPISNFSDDLITFESGSIPEALPQNLLEDLQEKIRHLGTILNSIQSQQVLDLTALAAKVMPTVVRVECLGGFHTVHGFYGEGSGSGCVISSDGYIVTNNHVIDGAKKIDILFQHTGLKFPANLIGTDPETDIALLKIESEEELSYSKFSDSNLVQVGTPSILVGSPLGFQNLLTTGFVGGKAPTLASSCKYISEYDLWDNGIYSDYIFSNTLSNPGNSGGPLFNLQGDIIGILSRGVTGPGGGISMSIAGNTALRIASELKEYGAVTRPFLGAELVDLDSPLIPYLITLMTPESMDLLDENPFDGLFVADILKDSPAMCLEKGDYIIAYNDTQVTTKDQFLADLAMRIEPSSTLKLTLIRDGEIIDVNVELGIRTVNQVVDIPRLGLRAENLDGGKHFAHHLDSGLEGVFVNAIDLESEASFRGLRPADIITSVIIDGKEEIAIRNARQLEQLIDQTDGDHRCVLVVRSYDRSKPNYILINLN